MAGSTTNIDLISSSQSSKEITANALFDALSAASVYGRRASTTSGLTWGYYGGSIDIAGVNTIIANGAITLVNTATNYIEVTPATGAVTVNQSSFTAGRIPLYQVSASGGSVVSYIDKRPGYRIGYSGTFDAGGKTFTILNGIIVSRSA